MLYLRDEAEKLGLKDFLPAVLERDGVQGVVLSLDDLWLASYFAERGLLPGTNRFYPPFDPRLGIGYPSGIGSQPTVMDGPLDIRERPNFWKDVYGDRSPIVVSVCLRPGAKQVPLREFNKFGFRLRQEYRPPARLASSPADQVRPIVGGVQIADAAGTRGTLGGVLPGSDGKFYGITCGHVAPIGTQIFQPKKNNGPGDQPIGRVVQATNLATSPSVAACNPYRGTTLNSVDLAAIELDPNVPASGEVLGIGPISGACGSRNLYPSLETQMAGATSGLRRLVIKELAATYAFADDTGEVCCFQDLVTVSWPDFYRYLLGRPVAGGDSGAWVTCNGTTGIEWCATIVGQDFFNGYASLADRSIDWLSSKHITPK